MMEIEEKEKIVIAKPVACRPRFTNPKSFSDLFSNASPPAAFTETAVAVIRPTTVRFKPATAIDLVKAPDSKAKCNVVYKPVAKLVSRTTVSLLSNLGSGIAPTREVGDVNDTTKPSNKVTHKTDATSEVQRPNGTLGNSSSADETKSLIPANNRERPAYDGHNWRKYGQKQVKGSEYPRSYYKCTYPNCPVKKKVEKTLDGQIAEIVYKGEHNHSKRLPPNHTPSDDATPKELQSRSTNQQAEIARAHEGRSENQDVTESSNQSTFSATPPIRNHNAGPSTSNNSLGLSGECEKASDCVEAEGGQFVSKRVKSDNQLLRASTAGEASSDPQIVVQKNSDSGIIGDGFRWRKYGQKVVKGKKYPRSYYRCTNPDCNVRKYVERTLEDPGAFITTYEGKHNHAMPIKSVNGEASKASSKK